MQPQLGQTQYYTRNVNGNDIYTALPYGGNIPYGYVPISKDQYVQGLQTKLQTAQQQLSNGQQGAGVTYSPADVQNFQNQIAQATSNQGINDPTYRDPSFSQFNANGQPTEVNYTEAEKARQADIPSNLGGTGPTIPVSNITQPDMQLKANEAKTPLASTIQDTTRPMSPIGSNFALSGGNLKVGSAGDNVKTLQTYLKGIGLYQGKIDGIYGPQTQSAVQQFQGTHGLSTDGIVGPKTVAAINAVQAGSPPPGTSLASTTSTTDTQSPTGGLTINGQNYSTGNPDTDAALKAIYDAGKTTIDQGYQLNPNLVLDQNTIDQFLTQATNSVHPYYAQQIQGIKDQLGRDVNKTKAEYENNLATEQGNFQTNLGNNRETWAGNGLAFSGQRGLGEQNMQNAENRTLDFNALNYGNQVGDLARNAEKQIGTNNMSGFQLPDTPSYKASLAGNSGGFNTTGSTSSPYMPGGFNVGSVTSDEASAIQNRQNSLINGAYDRIGAGRGYQDLLTK